MGGGHLGGHHRLHQRSQNLRHLDPGIGMKLGVFGFSRNQNKSDAYDMLPACTAVWAWRQTCVKMLDGARRLWTHLFCVCGRQKPEDPQIEPHGWRRHYTGRYKRSGISCVYLWWAQLYCTSPSLALDPNNAIMFFFRIPQADKQFAAIFMKMFQPLTIIWILSKAT